MVQPVGFPSRQRPPLAFHNYSRGDRRPLRSLYRLDLNQKSPSKASTILSMAILFQPWYRRWRYLDQIYAAKPESSSWLSDPLETPIPRTVSRLAVASPLYAAIWARRLKILARLLSFEFNPNAWPLAAVVRCSSPAMATIVYCGS